jgi:alkylation response protein AidB-like acyl-CoA dehydrogenase
MIYEALWMMDQGTATPDRVAMAKAATNRSTVEVVALAHQLHGGIGATEEYDLHFFSRRVKDKAVAWGTQDECFGTIAETIEVPVVWS